MEHKGVRGYNTFGHIKNADEVFRNVSNIHREITNSMVRVKLPTYEDEKTLFELKENLCLNFFKRYFQYQGKEKPIILPQVVPSEINKVVDTMKHWCIYSNGLTELKGVVIHSFDFSMLFRKLFYDEFNKEKLCKDLYMEKFTSTPITIVYNPKEKVILLIRNSENKSLRKEVELSSSDMKLFMVLFGDELKRSDAKVISLLVRNLEVDEILNCEDCKQSIVPVKTLESYESFKVLWDNRVSYYKVKNTDKFDNDKAEAFSAKLIGFLAAAQFFDNLPTFTEDTNEQMEHVLVMLTPEQKAILYSGEKHLIIKGPYGCGKTIIGRKKLQMLSEDFAKNKKNELVYFICYDPRSVLATEIGINPNVRVYCNEEGNKLSEIIKDINKKAEDKNVNLIVDEYDGESLDKGEAETLNDIFKRELRDSFVFLIPQSMEKDREVNTSEKKKREEKNMFHLLETMEKMELNLVMRNPIEISNLIWVTQNFLKDQQTIYRSQREKKPPIELTTLNENNTKQKQSGFEQKASTSNTALEKQFSESDDKVAAEVKSLGQRLVLKFGLDEAFDLANLARGSNVDVDKIVNSFKYIASDGTGHFINSCYPEVFEVTGDNTQGYSLKNLFALNFAFRKLNITNSNSNNKHVILKFNTRTEGIPKYLASVFEYLSISNKVTDNYRDFKYNKKKSILVCNFCSFRGLEHANITIIIDHDIYSVKHYLVEAMARCTNKLAIMVLQRSESISGILEKWEAGLNGKPLIDLWKVQINTGVMEKVKEDKELKLITINVSSEKYEAMRKQFDQCKVENNNFDMEQTAEELIEQW